MKLWSPSLFVLPPISAHAGVLCPFRPSHMPIYNDMFLLFLAIIESVTWLANDPLKNCSLWFDKFQREILNRIIKGYLVVSNAFWHYFVLSLTLYYSKQKHYNTIISPKSKEIQIRLFVLIMRTIVLFYLDNYTQFLVKNK